MTVVEDRLPAWLWPPHRGLVAGWALLVAFLAAAAGASAVPVLCAIALAGLAMVVVDDQYVPPQSYGLAGVADGVPAVRSIGSPTHRVAVAVAALLVLVVALAGAPGWIALAVLALAVVATALRCASYLVRRRHAVSVVSALTAHAPAVALGWAGRSAAPWQLAMWEPYLAASGERLVVVNLDAKYLPLIRREAGLVSPLVQVGSRGADDLDRLLVPSLRAMFHVQNSRRNRAFLAHDRLTHVWLGHGDSDKASGVSPRHAAYDLLVVSGEAAVERYARHQVRIPREKFVVLGRPQTETVRTETIESGTVQRAEGEQPVTVLYAPTWHGADASVNHSSLEQGPEIAAALIARGVQVVFRPHPLSYRWRERRAVVHRVRMLLKADTQASGRDHRWGPQVDREWSLAECINACDALVTDVSAVATDHLASGKPYAMVSRLEPADDLRARSDVAAAAYVVEADLANLESALDDLLGPDPLAESRVAARRCVLGDFTGPESAAAFADFVRTLAEGD